MATRIGTEEGAITRGMYSRNADSSGNRKMADDSKKPKPKSGSLRNIACLLIAIFCVTPSDDPYIPSESSKPDSTESDSPKQERPSERRKPRPMPKSEGKPPNNDSPENKPNSRGEDSGKPPAATKPTPRWWQYFLRFPVIIFPGQLESMPCHSDCGDGVV